MCTLTPVPQVVITTPWDAPLQWALFTGAMLFYAGLYALGVFAMRIARRRGRMPSVSIAALRLLGIAGVLVLCSLGMFLLVLWPAHDRLDAYFVSEQARMFASNCEAFNSAYAGAVQTEANWGILTSLVMGIGSTFAMAGGIVSLVGSIRRMVGKIMQAARRGAVQPAPKVHH